MGRTVAPLVTADPDLHLAGGTFRTGAAIDRAEGATLAGDPQWDGLLTDQPGELAAVSDVIVDFTTPESALVHAAACAAAGCGFVSGTTGFDAEQMSTLEVLATR